MSDDFRDHGVPGWGKDLPHNSVNATKAILMGMQHHKVGRLQQAEQYYRQVLAYDARNAQAIHLLGLIAYQVGHNDSAIQLIRKAIEIQPANADAYNNLGLALHVSGRPDEAIASYRSALTLQPESSEVHNNLGIALHDQGHLDEAVENFRSALSLQADYSEARYNLSNALKYQGHLDKAKKGYDKFLSLIPNGNYSPGPVDEVLEDVVALIPFGRAGSMFLQSLFDGHPDVATLPGVYFKGFFGRTVWQSLNPQTGHHRWRECLVERFTEEYAVLFDARIVKPVFGNPFGDSAAIGVNSGFTSMGTDRKESLLLDQDRFSKRLIELLKEHDEIDHKTFFKLLHIAFEQTLDRGIDPKTMLYHIHNPNSDEIGRFLARFPRARLLVMIREPVQSLESWIHLFLTDLEENRQPHEAGDTGQHRELIDRAYRRVVMCAVSMFDQMDDLAFSKAPAVGVRLEDVKKSPNTVMPRLAEWMGITDHPSLYESTFQGIEYWGPSSSMNPNLRGFDAANIKRKIGVVFSEQDARIFKTLFYPLAVQFGYQEANASALRQNLREIRNRLDEPLDFEKCWVQRVSGGHLKPEEFAACRLLRSRLKKTWRLLDEQGTFPWLPEPLHT